MWLRAREESEPVDQDAPAVTRRRTARGKLRALVAALNVLSEELGGAPAAEELLAALSGTLAAAQIATPHPSPKTPVVNIVANAKYFLHLVPWNPFPACPCKRSSLP